MQSATVDTKPANIDGNQFLIPTMEMDAPKTLEINWMDKLDYRPPSRYCFPIRCLDDLPPTVACSQLAEQRILLSTETLTFEVAAEDDYGMRHIGVEWQGVDDLSNREGTVAAHGERLVLNGDPKQRRLKGEASLSCKLEKIERTSPTNSSLHRGPLSRRGRIYSVPYLIKVMSLTNMRNGSPNSCGDGRGKPTPSTMKSFDCWKGIASCGRLEPSQIDQPESRRAHGAAGD